MPIKVTITGARPRKISTSEAQTALHKELTKLWIGAGRAFIRTVALEGVVRVDTGMSRASLLPLSRAVGLLTAVRASITADRARRRERGTGGKSTKTKTIAAGIRAGQNAFDFDTGTPANPKLIFEFEIKVLQYLINEEGREGRAAWDSLIKGRAAFLRYFENNAGPNLQVALSSVFNG
jgi:hypothetical protein